eukprot:TRINITY_DN5762_c0_g1_i12.p1 TRINITY_DN5762_c0_g1~~TRINITY_DN5762_c0_g1_i12.p1  ORF type:complete len:618 (-),score=180.77 TRINITY_DN5762_c0_g1_i12:26-1879(-)
MYSYSAQPRATGLVTTTKKSVSASDAFFCTLRERAGVTVRSRRSKKIAPKPMPARHKTDPFNNKTVHPFTELNLYLNCDELMQEEEDEENRAAERNQDDVLWSVQLDHNFQNGQKDKIAARQPWTNDERELKRLMGLQVKAGKTFGADFFFEFFTTLRLYEAGIQNVDRAFLQLKNLKELTLSGNSLTTLENLPPTIEVLNVQYNQLESLGGVRQLKNLQHLGVSYNQLESLEELGEMAAELGELRSLDVGFNSLCNHADTTSAVQKLLCLKNLVIAGNPLCLIPSFRLSVVSELPLLRWLDDVTISAGEKTAALNLATNKQRLIELAAAAEVAAAEAAAAPAEEPSEDAAAAAAAEDTEAAVDELEAALAATAGPEPPQNPFRVQLEVAVTTLDNLHKMSEISEEEEQALLPEGPWMAEPVEGEAAPPPKPVLVHSFLVTGRMLDAQFESHEIPQGEVQAHIKLEMGATIPELLPSARVRDLIHSCGLELHIVRRTFVKHSPNAAFYAALVVPEDSSEEEAAKLREAPADSQFDTLVRVGACSLAPLLQGHDTLPLQCEMWLGSAVERAQLDNYSVVFDNRKYLHSGILSQAHQTLRLQVAMTCPGEAELESANEE